MKTLILLLLSCALYAQDFPEAFDLDYTTYVLHRDSTDLTASQKERIQAMHLAICEVGHITVYADSSSLETISRNTMTAVGYHKVTKVVSTERKVSIIWFRHVARLND